MKVSSAPISYPIGIQSFPKLRENGFLYVDKTEYVHLLTRKPGFYFLSRPRRFGKSLFLSTVEAYYRGRRDLFKGLALDALTDDWEPHPVLHLDLNNRVYNDMEALVGKLTSALETWEQEYGLHPTDTSPEGRFGHAIERIHALTGKKVVILIDEYDKPLLAALHDHALYDRFVETLKGFYGNLKTMDEHIEMAMLTGVARFGKVSIFSDLNNLRDISYEDDFAAICGVTSEELARYFAAGVMDLAKSLQLTQEATLEELKKLYDGYHFAKNMVDIYNPFSLMNVFAKRDTGLYWFATGTPTYLLHHLRKMGRPLKTLIPCRISQDALERASLIGNDPIPALYQSGYLTIKAYDRRTRYFTLDFPNEEVRHGFLQDLLTTFFPTVFSTTGYTLADFVDCVMEGRAEDMMKRLQSVLASIPYSERGSKEDHFQNLIFILFPLLGMVAHTEQRTSDGRIDLSVETGEYLYIFEFKIDRSPEEAIRQIHEKEYWLPYRFAGKGIFLIGANFSTSTGRLTGWQIEEIGGVDQTGCSGDMA